MQTFWNINNGGKLYFAFIILLLSATTILFYTCDDSPIKPLSPSTDSEKTKHGIEPAWSPAGNRIAYIGGATDKEFGIYDIDVAANENPRKIAVPEFASNPDWSPDGKWIVYSRNGNIWKKAVEDDSSEIQLTSNAENFFPSWSKDGEWIAFDSNMDSPSGLRFVWKMRADGSEKKRIIYSPQQGEVRMPDWFPDGIRLAVARNLGGPREIAIIDTSGNSIAQLTNDERPDNNPSVSMDGLSIVFEKEENYGQIFRINADGTEHIRISDGNSNDPNWSPDGKWVTFFSHSPTYIYVMDLNGNYKRRL